MMSEGHWDLQCRLLVLLSASDAALTGGGCMGVGGVSEMGVKVAPGKGDNETAGLVITMGLGPWRG